MNKENDFEVEETTEREEYSGESASRARNRTVMLTPEMTNQVRSRFQQEEGEPQVAPMSLPNPRNPVGFETPRSTNGAGHDHSPSSGGFITPQATNARVGYLDPAPAPQPRPVMAPTPVAMKRSSDEGVVWVKEAPVVGFLVSYDMNPMGSVFELRVGRLIVTNQPSHENHLMLSDPSVSFNHAIIRVGQSGEIQVLDQLSEMGTSIRRFGAEEAESLSGEKASVEHGDVLRFGKISFHVCMVQRGS